MKTLRLEEIAKIQAGYQSRTTIRKVENGTHLLIQGKDIDDGCISKNGLVPFNPDVNPDLYHVNKDDILFQARGSIHGAVIAEKEIPNALASGSFYIIRPNSDLICPGYLAWWLNQPAAQSFFKSEGSTTVISFVPKSALLQIKIPLPSMEVQVKIEKIQQLLQKEQHLISRLTELRQLLANAICNQHSR